jgi:hypothetical protein
MQTFLDGKLTQNQIIMIVIAIIVVLLVLKFLKGIVRTIITIVVICVALCYYGYASPSQIKDSASLIADKGISTYQTLAKQSENIQVSGNTVKVKIQGEWFSLDDIKTVATSGATVSVTVNDKTLTVDDDKVADLLNSTSDKNIIQKLLKK